MKITINKIISKIKRMRYYILNKNGHYKVNIFNRIRYAFKNISADEYYCYNLKKNDYKEYIYDYERVKGRNINGEYKIILDNKILFEEIFRNYIRVPINYAYISNGHVYALHDYNINNDNVIEFINKVGMVVLKMLNGYEGKGVYLIKYLKNNLYQINGEESDYIKIKNIIKSCNESILCEYVFQSQFENDIFEKTTNTLRIVCAKAKNEKNAHIIKAAQRIGNNSTIPVDNISAGGLASEIDIETGKLGYAMQKYRNTIDVIKYEKHPDNGAQIKGKIVPNWLEIKNKIENLTNRFPYLKLVAWDVLLTDDGICIIEGNASSGCGLFQLEHGIRNEEYGEIYRSYGIIK